MIRLMLSYSFRVKNLHCTNKTCFFIGWNEGVGIERKRELGEQRNRREKVPEDSGNPGCRPGWGQAPIFQLVILVHSMLT